MSYLEEIDPQALLDYKERAKEIYNSLNSNSALEQAEGLTNAALGLGITLHHAGILGKDGLFSSYSDYIGDAKNIRELGQNTFNKYKQLAQDKLNDLTSGEGEEGEGIIGTLGQSARNLISGATGDESGLIGTLGQSARNLISGATGDESGLIGTIGQSARDLITGEGGGIVTTAKRGLFDSILSRIRRPTTQNQEAEGVELQDLSAFEPSQEIQNLTNTIYSAGVVKPSDFTELRNADPLQVSRILDGDPTELGRGMSDQLFDRLLQTRQKLVATGKTLTQESGDGNIYSYGAGDAINQARQSGELTGGETKETTQLTLQEPKETDTMGQEGIKADETQKNIFEGQESLEQSAKSGLAEEGEEAGADVLGELAADSMALDETPVGGLITVGLGIASLFEDIFGIHHDEKAPPIVQSGQQIGV